MSAPTRPWLLLVALAAVAPACARHIHMKVPQTTPSSSYRCASTGPCTPSDVLVPSESNRSRTTPIRLPKACAGRFSEIHVEDAGSSSPIVRVACATRDEPIGDMD